MTDNPAVHQSRRLFLGLLLLLAGLAMLGVFLPQGERVAAMTLPAPRPLLALANAVVTLVLYGSLGLIGMALSRRLGFPDLVNPACRRRAFFVEPVGWGIALGLCFIVFDWLLSGWHDAGRLPHPPFPTSLVASAGAAIGEEILFRLFLMSLLLWLWVRLRHQESFSEPVFWSMAALSGLLFALGHLPSLLFFLEIDSPAGVPAALWLEMIVLNGSLSLVAAGLYRHYGIVAAMAVHWWTDVVWHVLYGLVA